MEQESQLIFNYATALLASALTQRLLPTEFRLNAARIFVCPDLRSFLDVNAGAAAAITVRQ